MGTYSGVDRRHHKRYRVRDGTYAVLAPPLTMLGQVLDVSRSGIAFSCVAREEDLEPVFLFDILLASKDFSLCKVQAEIVSSFRFSGVFFDGSVGKRRIGAKFSTLTGEQKSELDVLIREHAVGEA